MSVNRKGVVKKWRSIRRLSAVPAHLAEPGAGVSLVAAPKRGQPVDEAGRYQ
jgi:hypothetical protein